MTTQPVPSIAEITKGFELVPAQGITEIRARCADGIRGGFYDAGAVVQAVFNLSAQLGTSAVWRTVQELDKPAEGKTKYENVKRFRWLVVDIDPTRATGFDTQASSDEEKASARHVAEQVRAFLITLGIASILIDSANGFHVYIPLDVPPSALPLMKRVLDALNTRFGNPSAPIDSDVVQLVFKVPGTVSRKGNHTAERPHRISTILDAPEITARLDEPQLESLLASVLAGLTPEQQAARVVPSGEAASADAVAFSLQEVKDFLQWGGVSYTREKVSGDLRMLVMPCIFEHTSGKHSNDEAWVGVNETTARRFKCMRCDAEGGKGWNEFRAELEVRKGERYRFAPPPEDPTEYEFSAKPRTLPEATPGYQYSASRPGVPLNALDNQIIASILWTGTIIATAPKFILSDPLGNCLEFASREAARAALLANLQNDYRDDPEFVAEFFKQVDWKVAEQQPVVADEQGAKFKKGRVEGGNFDYVLDAKDFMGSALDDYEGWFARGSVHMVGGSSGAGKSRFMIPLLDSQEKGERCLGHTSHSLSYLMLLADRGKRALIRTLKSLNSEGATRNSAALPSGTGLKAVLNIQRAIEARDVTPAIVFVEGADMLVDDPNSMPDVSALMKGLERIAEHYHIAFILTVGSRKLMQKEAFAAKRDSLFGSTAWARNGETVVIVEGSDPSTERRVFVMSRNGKSELFHMEFVKGRFVEREEQPEEAPELPAVTFAKGRTGYWTVQDYMDAVGHSRATAFRHIKQAQEAGKVREKTGKGKGHATQYTLRELADSD
jgi:hypothetical protein